MSGLRAKREFTEDDINVILEFCYHFSLAPFRNEYPNQLLHIEQTIAYETLTDASDTPTARDNKRPLLI